MFFRGAVVLAVVFAALACSCTTETIELRRQGPDAGFADATPPDAGEIDAQVRCVCRQY